MQNFRNNQISLLTRISLRPTDFAAKEEFMAVFLRYKPNEYKILRKEIEVLRSELISGEDYIGDAL